MKRYGDDAMVEASAKPLARSGMGTRLMMRTDNAPYGLSMSAIPSTNSSGMKSLRSTGAPLYSAGIDS